MPAANVLDEAVSGDHDPGAVFLPDPAHSSSPRLETTISGLDPVGDRVATNALWSYQDPLPERTDIKGYLALYWHRMDAWFEEDDEVFAHPRDPSHRVDVLSSSRHERVVVAGQALWAAQRSTPSPVASV